LTWNGDKVMAAIRVLGGDLTVTLEERTYAAKDPRYMDHKEREVALAMGLMLIKACRKSTRVDPYTEVEHTIYEVPVILPEGARAGGFRDDLEAAYRQGVDDAVGAILEEKRRQERASERNWGPCSHVLIHQLEDVARKVRSLEGRAGEKQLGASSDGQVS
jgi:hypothetical protein